jgi:hypothetical protein
MRAAFRIFEPPLTYRPWGPEIWKAHIAGPSPIQNGLWDPQRERPKVMLLFVFSSIRSFPSFLPPLLCCFLPSFLPFFVATSSPFYNLRQRASQVKWSGIRSRSWCSSVYVCVCVLAQLICSPIYANSFDFWESWGRPGDDDVEQPATLCVVLLMFRREVGGQTLRPPFSLSLSLSLPPSSQRDGYVQATRGQQLQLLLWSNS